MNALNEVNSSKLPEMFPSIAALRAAHTQLLKQQQIQPEDAPELLAAIEQFIQQGQVSGALIDGDDDRWACQSLLDYWSTVLYRTGKPIADVTLAEFDPSFLPTLDDSLCPYLGLEAFRESSHNHFFGRHRLVDILIHHLKDHRLLAVVGSSGSGKSSTVMAGLLPQLKAGALPNSQSWEYYPPIVPGSNPLLALARLLQPTEGASEAWLQTQVQQLKQDPTHLLRLISQVGRGSVVLCIDQFEEVFPLEPIRKLLKL